MRLNSEQRFWKKVDRRNDGDCWNWIGATHGSGQKRGCFWDGKRKTDAARWLWQQTHGKQLEASHVVMHTCDNPLCVNPAHLVMGTQAQNVADMWAKGRQNMAAIREGAARGRQTLAEQPDRRARGERHGVHKRNLAGENNPQSRLTREDVSAIKGLAGQKSQRAIAAQYGVNQAVVWRIINGKAWVKL
jgi:hypothetical protein